VRRKIDDGVAREPRTAARHGKSAPPSEYDLWWVGARFCHAVTGHFIQIAKADKGLCRLLTL
jgi:hypothetical protein